MESFAWWTDDQKALLKELEDFVNEVTPTAEKAWWTKEIPWDIIHEIARRGYFGAAVPKSYGGMELGATGACIIVEQLCRLPWIGLIFLGSSFGGVHQILKFGNPEQKSRLLPKIAKGELGAIAITEPFAGTDAAAIETTATKAGDKYIIKGKKRFVTGAGLANRYMLYAKTSDTPEQKARRTHLTGFIVEKGMRGFTIEKINELIGFDNVPNGYLNLDNTPVPAHNRIGEEGQGWRVMMAGLNFERIAGSAWTNCCLSEALRYAVCFGKRRVQFGSPILEVASNKLKVAEIVTSLKLARLATYYAAYLLDIGDEAAIDASVCNLFSSDMSMKTSIDAAQIMGGDGITKFYPIERILRDSKISQIAGGTTEATKLSIFGKAIKILGPHLEMPRRIIDEELGVPIPTFAKVTAKLEASEGSLLKLLADDYLVNPALHMTRDEMKDAFDVADTKLDEILTSLENKRLAKLYRKRGIIEMAKATYEGLDKVHPNDFYRWFPTWVRSENIF